MKKLLTIGALALTGCGHLNYTVEPIKPIPITGVLPAEDESAMKDQVEKPWADICGIEKKNLDEDGKYRAVIEGEEGKLHNVVYEVDIFQGKNKTCRIYLDKDTTIEDDGCNGTADSLFSFEIGKKIDRPELKKWGLADFLDKWMDLTRESFPCYLNLIKPEEIKGVEKIRDKYK